MSNHQVLWLRNDLRLHDNAGLRLAAEAGLPVCIVFILPPQWISKDAQGLNRLGNAKATFLRACLIDLQRSLAAANLTLHILSGDPVTLLSRLTGRDGILLTAAPQAPEEESWIRQLSQQLQVQTYTAQTLLDREQLRPLLSDWPQTFSRFRRWLQKQTDLSIPADESSETLSLSDHPCSVSAPASWPDQPGADIRLPLNGGERIARQHLQNYLWRTRAVRHYRETRNRLTGTQSSSLFSAHLAWGALSVREAWRQLQAWEQVHGTSYSVRALRDELLWREYFHWSLVVHGASLFRRSGLRGCAEEAVTETPAAAENWRAWCEARTGVPGIDAGLVELQRTGFISNRLRQNMASYFVHELKLDWRLGARWFEQHLIDSDPGSNYGNWAYIAGVGHNPRESHRFHLNQQLQHYDPQLEHLRLWLPELQEQTVEDILRHQQGKYLLTSYPAPVAVTSDPG